LIGDAKREKVLVAEIKKGIKTVFNFRY
jgi:hypothetical protein